ncbi:MAG: hypothetical protein BZ135_09010, partial [Methanosphaera sp. rholeuAM6]
INANNQTLSAKPTSRYTRFNNGCNITINDATINHRIQNYINLTLVNSCINSTTTNYGNLIITNDVTFGENFAISGSGNIITNRTDLALYLTDLNGNFTIENMNITKGKTNYGNLTIRNSTFYYITNSGNIILYDYINGGITNNGNLTITDDVIFGDKFYIGGSGNVISNRTDLIQYFVVLNGTYVFENQIISVEKTNYGNLTIRNATINNRIANYGNLTICDDVIFGENFAIEEHGQTFINDSNKLAPYMTHLNGTYVIENSTYFISNFNYGNLTVINSIMNKTAVFSNEGTLTIKNSTVDEEISNSGTLIICDDVIFGPNFYIMGSGEVIINDTNRIIPYLYTYNGDYVLENMTINPKTNNGNLTIRNSTIIGQIQNNGNVTLENSLLNSSSAFINKGILNITNSTLNSQIGNSGTLILSDDIILDSNFRITGTGHVFAENLTQIFPYLPGFYDEGIVELGNYTKQINNYGKLTIENSTLSGIIWGSSTSETTLKNTTTTGSVTNSNKMTFTNATINGAVTNNGVLTISDDTVIGPNFSLKGNGDIIMNDTQKIADYLTKYTGNIVLTNKTINTNKVNQDNLTLNNCTIDATIENNGRIYIDENTVFTENGKITGNGEIITDNITRLLPYISAINGNYTITDTTLNKSYTFNGNVTLENCNITTPNNSNFGT